MPIDLRILDDAAAMGRAAAAHGAAAIREAIGARGSATVIVATGASQFEVLAALVEEDVDWPRVTGFHLDEYVGLTAAHPASFCRYLRERFVSKVSLAAFHYVDGEADPEAECDRLGRLIGAESVDVAFIGIGENAHIAFNDPPADFETERPYLVVELDEVCRRQQLGEGWFETLDDVPRRAISMSPRQILKSRTIVCSVPDERKAAALAATIEGDVSPEVPASIVQTHADTVIFCDWAAASKLAGG